MGKKIVAKAANTKLDASKKTHGKSSTAPLPAALFLQSQQQQETPTLVLQPLVPHAVYTSSSFLSSLECQAWIHFIESDPSKLIYTQCSRWQTHDWSMADALFQRMKQSTIISQLSDSLGSMGGQCPIAANGHLRVYKYERNMSFGKHVDGSEDTPRGKTQVTVLIYLSNATGGATRFHFGRRQEAASEPAEGKILFHVHGDRCLVHEADEVQQGIKYVLRTDLVYG